MIRRDLLSAVLLLLFPVLLHGQEEVPRPDQEPCIPAVTKQFEGKATGVTDGDTVRVLTDDKTVVKLPVHNRTANSLSGIDSREVTAQSCFSDFAL